MRYLNELKRDFLDGKINDPKNWLGDSLHRFDLYTEYATKCDTIVELGVYTGLTSVAFLLGNPTKMTSVDITDEYFEIKPEVENAADNIGCDYNFIVNDSRTVDIHETDMLLIDTYHTEEFATIELNKHHKRVKNYIMLHDTTLFPGVFLAVAKWLGRNRDWCIEYHDNIHCGTTVLKRTGIRKWL